MTAVGVAILGLLLAGSLSEALHKDYKAYLGTPDKESAQKDGSPKRQRACLLANGPQNKKECEVFEKRWLNETKETRRQMNPSIDFEVFGNMSKKDVVVMIGCHAMYTFAQQMWDTCLDANLLTDLLLCQYDNLEDKSAFLKELPNIKERQDVINFMEDFKKCAGTAEEPMEQPDGSHSHNIAVMEIFVRPMKKMRSYLERNLHDPQN